MENASYEISAAICTRMKTSIGYRATKQLILESEFSFDAETQLFMSSPENTDEVIRAYDHKIKKEFMFNPLTGFTAWVETYRGSDGMVLREECYRTDRRHLVHFQNQSDSDSDDEYDSYFGGGSSVGSRTLRSRGSTRTKNSKSSGEKKPAKGIRSQLPKVVQPQMLF